MRHISFLSFFAFLAIVAISVNAFGQWGGGYLNKARQAIGQARGNAPAAGNAGDANTEDGEEADDDEDDDAAPSDQEDRDQAAPVNRPAPPVRGLKKVEKETATEYYAFIVAVRDYPKSSQLPTLFGTDRDAIRLAEALQNGRYPKDNIVVMYDDASKPNLLPTRDNIEQELNAFLSRAGESSVVTVFFTGHGVSWPGKSYLCPGDATDAALENASAAAEKLVSVEDVAVRLSKNCKAANKLLVVDACRDTSKNRTSDYVKNVKTFEESAEGVWLLSSCSEGEFSWMSDLGHSGQKHALFSYYVAEGLEGNADVLGNNDGEVSLNELNSYVVVKTRAAAKEIHQKQSPELFGSLAHPFRLATTSNFASRRQLTTSDPKTEDLQSASLLADDVIVNLRSADKEFRETVTASEAKPETVQQSNHVLHRYLCHMLGNRIQTALDLSRDCRLAFVAKGLCYRTCDMYEEALGAFNAGGEDFSLFVKPAPDAAQKHLAFKKGEQVLDKDGYPVPFLGKKTADKDGVGLYKNPGDREPTYSVQRQQKVRVAKIQGEWLYVTAIDDWELNEGAWIRRDEVIWFPEAVDLYAPATPMHPWNGGAVNRLDAASDRLTALSERLGRPARRIEEISERIGAPIDRWNNSIGGRFFSIPNYPRIYGGMAAGYASIPSNYVAMVNGYVQIPASIAHTAQQWGLVANNYYAGHQQEENIEKSRREMRQAGRLDPVKERPVVMVEISLSKKHK